MHIVSFRITEAIEFAILLHLKADRVFLHTDAAVIFKHELNFVMKKWYEPGHLIFRLKQCIRTTRAVTSVKCRTNVALFGPIQSFLRSVCSNFRLPSILM